MSQCALHVKRVFFGQILVNSWNTALSNEASWQKFNAQWRSVVSEEFI